jgi:serine protease inhibitor
MRTIIARVALGALVAAALALTLTAFGCASARHATVPAVPAAPVAAPSSPEPSGLSGAAAVNAFGLDLMRARLATGTPTDNVVLSPLSVHAALSMTLQGARGKTAAEMQRTLHLSGDATAAASTYLMLLSALNDRSKAQTLTVANALWIDQRLPVKREFLNANRIGFGATAHTLDLQQTSAVGTVNKWVADNTNDMIKQIIDRIDPQAVMLLTDAVYFKARWVQKFDAVLTRKEPFHPAIGKPVDVQMMHETEQLPVVDTATFSATKLRYVGGDSAAYIILPDRAHRLDDVLSHMTSADFATLRDRLDSVPPTLTALDLPKLDATVGGEIGNTLKTMGMPVAFDPLKADFGGMAPVTPDNNIYINRVLHKARLKVDEGGTEAAAATVVEMDVGSAMSSRPAPLPFTCDRPFAFAIVDTKTGALLFLAAVRNPKAQ